MPNSSRDDGFSPSGEGVDPTPQFSYQHATLRGVSGHCQLSPSRSVNNFCNISDNLATDDNYLDEEEVEQLLKSNDTLPATSFEEVELEPAISRRRRWSPFRRLWPRSWLDSLMESCKFRPGLFRPGSPYGCFRDEDRPKHKTKLWKKEFRWFLLFLLGFFVMLGVIQFIILLCGAIISFFPEGLDEDWNGWGSPGGSTGRLAHWPTDATRDIVPVACHSHNDYFRKVPLFSAIKAGCTGVEADVWLVNDELYVGHKKSALTESRTLRNLYVNPLADLLDKQNSLTQFHPERDDPPNGVFDTEPEKTLVLLIDFKTKGKQTWPYVVSQLSPLRDRGYLTYYDGTKVRSGPITVVATGNAPFDLLIANSTYRDIFFDAPLDEMADEQRPDRIFSMRDTIDSAERYNPSNSYYASVSYKKAVGYPVFFHVTSTQRALIRAQIEGAHRRGLNVRYWGTPNWPRSLRNYIWTFLVREGVDYLNVDDLKSATTQDWRHRFRDWWF